MSRKCIKKIKKCNARDRNCDVTKKNNGGKWRPNAETERRKGKIRFIIVGFGLKRRIYGNL